MKRITVSSLILGLTFSSLFAQKPPNPQKSQERAPDDVLRITTELVQTDVVVMDKDEQPVRGLKLEDFELYENGKKQDLQFVEFISVDDSTSPIRSSDSDKTVAGIDNTAPRDLTATDVRRVIAFVVDDVTIPTEDMSRVRQMLSGFVDNKMADGDLVAIIRTVGGKGLLEQFTTDRQILRRAISQLGVRSIPPHLALSGSDTGRVTTVPNASGTDLGVTGDASASATISSGLDFEGPTEGTNQIPRATLALSVANQIINSLRQVPGRKNLILVSGGLPLFDLTRSGAVVADISQLFRLLTDNATRSGVAINTLDISGLATRPTVARFSDTPARSGLANLNTEQEVDPLETPGAGGGIFGDERRSTGPGTAGGRFGGSLSSGQLGLRVLAEYTGGVSVVNTNNFAAGLDRVMQRSRAYYRLAYRPTERFDNKFHKVEVKVRRPGARVYAAEGYVAREDRSEASATKEEQIIKAGLSPLARRDLDVAAELQYQFTPNNQAQLDINVFIDARKLKFTRSADGKYVTSFDVAGFVFDQFGKNRGGISQTINADLPEQEYQRALADGIGYTASTQAPPGLYQVRLVVREAETGKIGTVSRYFEVPDLTNKQLMMSSVMLYQVNIAGADKTPQQLAATRVISRKNDLRYAVSAYNVKLEGAKPQAKCQLMISQAGKLLFKEPEQPIQTAGTAPGQFIKVGQLGLSKVPPGRYVLTLIVTDPLADRKRQIVSRSVDFTVVD